MAETVRQQIIALLSAGHELTILDISQAVGVMEREVPDHLGHIKRTLARQGRRLRVTPPSCLACGYTFKKRQRLDRPGRCPICKASHISQAAFAII
ncbi:MAG: transcriptional regulator [Thermodesulfobacteriota bacterium]